MKKFIMVIFAIVCLSLFNCHSRSRPYPYQPTKSNVSNPIPFIESAIELQPPTYAYLPVKVEVTNEYIKLVYLESAYAFPVRMFTSSASQVETTRIIRYEHIGSLKLYRTDVWWVEILDPAGNNLYSIYTFKEDRAKKLIDALTIMIDEQ